jgi:hypothetical protein
MMAMNYNGPQYYLQNQMQYMIMMKLFGNNNNSTSNKTIPNHLNPNNVTQQGLSQVDPDITGQYKEKMQNMNHLIQQQEISKLQNLYQKQVNYYENLNFENGEHSKQNNWQDPIGSDHPMISYLMDELDRKNKMVHKYRNGKKSGGDHYRSSGRRNKTGGSHPGVFRLTPLQRVTDEKIRMRPQGIALPELKKLELRVPSMGNTSAQQPRGGGNPKSTKRTQTGAPGPPEYDFPPAKSTMRSNIGNNSKASSRAPIKRKTNARGKKLFRIVAIAVYYYFVLRTKLQQSVSKKVEKSKIFYKDNLRIYFRECEMWLQAALGPLLGKIISDHSLNFDIIDAGPTEKVRNFRDLHQSVLSIAAELRKITIFNKDSSFDNDKVLMLLSQLSLSGNFLPDKFMLDFELDRINFSSYGSMVNCSEGKLPSPNKNNRPVQDADRHVRDPKDPDQLCDSFFLQRPSGHLPKPDGHPGKKRPMSCSLHIPFDSQRIPRDLSNDPICPRKNYYGRAIQPIRGGIFLLARVR